MGAGLARWKKRCVAGLDELKRLFSTQARVFLPVATCLCVPHTQRVRVCAPQDKKPSGDVMKEIDRVKALLDPLEAKKQIELSMPKIREDPVRGGERQQDVGVDISFV